MAIIIPSADPDKVPIVYQDAGPGRYQGQILHDRFQVNESFTNRGQYYVIDYDSALGTLRGRETGKHDLGPVLFFESVEAALDHVERTRDDPPRLPRGWKGGTYRESLYTQHETGQAVTGNRTHVDLLFDPGTTILPATSLRLIHDGVMAGEATETLYKRLKLEYPQTGYPPRWLDWYRQELAKRNMLPKDVAANMENLEMAKAAPKTKTADAKPAKAPAAKKPAKVTAASKPSAEPKAAKVPAEPKVAKTNGATAPAVAATPTVPKPAKVPSADSGPKMSAWVKERLLAGKQTDDELLKLARETFVGRAVAANFVKHYRAQLAKNGQLKA